MSKRWKQEIQHDYGNVCGIWLFSLAAQVKPQSVHPPAWFQQVACMKYNATMTMSNASTTHFTDGTNHPWIVHPCTWFQKAEHRKHRALVTIPAVFSPIADSTISASKCGSSHLVQSFVCTRNAMQSLQSRGIGWRLSFEVPCCWIKDLQREGPKCPH